MWASASGSVHQNLPQVHGGLHHMLTEEEFKGGAAGEGAPEVDCGTQWEELLRSSSEELSEAPLRIGQEYAKAAFEFKGRSVRW